MIPISKVNNCQRTCPKHVCQTAYFFAGQQNKGYPFKMISIFIVTNCQRANLKHDGRCKRPTAATKLPKIQKSACLFYNNTNPKYNFALGGGQNTAPQNSKL